jgi:hypothetical protein
MSVSPASSSRVAPPRWVFALVLVAAVAGFLPTLTGGFLADDFVYIKRFQDLAWADWPRTFISDWSGGVWGQPLRELRPFAALSMMSDAKLFGGAAIGYRLVNLALHVIATMLVVRLAWRYAAGSVTAVAVAGLVFALHPAHAEPVAWVTGRVDTIATAAALLFWLAAELYAERGNRWHLGVALVAFFLGMFSKELCMFAPGLLVLRWGWIELRVERAVWVRRGQLVVGVAAIFGLYAWARHVAFGHDSIGYNLWTDEPAWRRQAAHWGWLVPLLPFTGRQEWVTPWSLGTLHAVWLGALAVVAVGLTWSAWRGTRRTADAWFFGGVWFFVTVFPLTGVVYFAPRHLYFPTVGLAIAVGLVCAAGGWRAILGGAIAIWCAVALVWAVRPWMQAAAASRDALAALDRERAVAPGDVVLTAVGETLGPVWLWAWSSPQSTGAPFLAHPVPPSQLVERPVNYVLSDKWAADRHPVETLRGAAEAIALFVDGEGRVWCRRAPRAQLQAAAAKLAAAGFNNDSWDACVQSLAQPPP